VFVESTYAGFNSSVIQYVVLSLCDNVRCKCPLMYFNTASIQFPAVLYLYWVTNTGMNNDDGWNGCKHFAGLDADVQIAAVIMAVLL
jgi:hypothetical protein